MVLIHEACCHPLEADEVLRSSVYRDRLGTAIASEAVTIVDDALVPGAAGSYRVDDEGVTARATPLVEEGRLVSFLTDRLGALRLGVGATGNGRRDTYRSTALPRMSNTRVAAGEAEPEELVATVRRGVFARHVGGGEVVESTGDFVFRITNGFLIEDGRITDPIEETTVRGNGAEVLRDVELVASDVAVAAARCGKHGQFVPVGLVGPTLKIRSLLVGGTVR
jgi:TldD protein